MKDFHDSAAVLSSQIGNEAILPQDGYDDVSDCLVSHRRFSRPRTAWVGEVAIPCVD